MVLNWSASSISSSVPLPIASADTRDARSPSAIARLASVSRRSGAVNRRERIAATTTAIANAITVIETPGHTEHHCSIAVDDGAGAKIVFLGDLVPTTHHLPYPWIMAYDLYPVTTLETKQRLLPRAVDEAWLCAFVHDADIPLCYLTLDDRGRPRPDPGRDPWSG